MDELIAVVRHPLGPGGEQAAHVGSGNPGVSADEDWAALNVKFWRVAMGYFAQYTRGRMVIIHKVFEPFRILLLDQIGLGSEKWEREQRSIAALTRRQQQQKEETLQLVVCSMWRPVRMESANGILVVQLGTNANEAKVFKAHTVPLGSV